MSPSSTNPPDERSVPETEPLTFEQERDQLRRRRLRWIVPLTLLLLAGGWFAARPVAHEIKAWHARRLAERSLAAADAGHLEEAADHARDAFQIYRAEPEVWRALGRLLSRVGQGGQAILWWQKVDRAGRLTVADRRDWVVAALAADAPAQATAQLEWLLAQKGGGLPADLLLAARDAIWHNDPERAESFDRRVLAAPAASPDDRFHAAAQILYLTAPKAESLVIAAEEVIIAARSGAGLPAREALTLAATRTLAGAGLPGLPPLEIAAALETHPQAGPIHRLLALELHARAEPARIDEWVTEAVRQFGGSPDDHIVAALSEWLSRLGKYEAALQVLDPVRAARTTELARTFLDILAAAGRWSEAREVLGDKQLPLDPIAAAMYLAVVRAHLGEVDGSAREWDRALDVAGKDATKLLTLGLFASHQGAQNVADQALGAAVAAAPASRAPYIARYQLALARGRTGVAMEMVMEVLHRWPDDRATSDEGLYLRLLLDPGVATADAAENETAARLAQDPANWQVRTNAALVRLRQGRGAAALGALTAKMEDASSLSGVLDAAAPVRAQAVYTAALAASGERGRASKEAQRLKSLSMLPEERALIVPLLEAGSQP